MHAYVCVMGKSCQCTQADDRTPAVRICTCHTLTTRTADAAASALSPNGRRRRRRQNRRRSEDDAARRARFDLEDTALLGEAATSKRGVVLRKLERPFHSAAAATGTTQCSI
jgi:hypothetical protein